MTQMKAVARLSGSVVDLPDYDAMLAAIEKVKSFDEINALGNKAEALRAYWRQASNINAEMDCAEIRFRAQRRAGQMLAAMDAEGLTGIGDHRSGLRKIPLRELGIKSAHQAQALRRLANMEEANFDRLIVNWRASNCGRSIARPLSAEHLNEKLRRGAQQKRSYTEVRFLGRVIAGMRLGEAIAAIEQIDAMAAFLRALVSHAGGASHDLAILDCVSEQTFERLRNETIGK